MRICELTYAIYISFIFLVVSFSLSSFIEKIRRGSNAGPYMYLTSTVLLSYIPIVKSSVSFPPLFLPPSPSLTGLIYPKLVT